MKQPTIVLFAEPFGPWSRTSRFGRPSRTKFDSDAVNLPLDPLLADERAAREVLLLGGHFGVPREVEELPAGELSPGDSTSVVP